MAMLHIIALGCPRPHMQFKGKTTPSLPLFGKGREVEEGKQREPTLPLPLFGKVEIIGCPRPHIPLSGEVEEVHFG